MSARRKKSMRDIYMSHKSQDFYDDHEQTSRKKSMRNMYTPQKSQDLYGDHEQTSRKKSMRNMYTPHKSQDFYDDYEQTSRKKSMRNMYTPQKSKDFYDNHEQASRKKSIRNMYTPQKSQDLYDDREQAMKFMKREPSSKRHSPVSSIDFPGFRTDDLELECMTIHDSRSSTFNFDNDRYLNDHSSISEGERYDLGDTPTISKDFSETLTRSSVSETILESESINYHTDEEERIEVTCNSLSNNFICCYQPQEPKKEWQESKKERQKKLENKRRSKQRKSMPMLGFEVDIDTYVNNLEEMFYERDKKVFQKIVAISKTSLRPKRHPMIANNASYSVDSVATTYALSKGMFRGRLFREKQQYRVRQQWKMTLQERTSAHPGYSTVNRKALLDSTNVFYRKSHKLDKYYWEKRRVDQGFLNNGVDSSQSKNCLLNLVSMRERRRAHPISHPKMMMMHVNDLIGYSNNGISAVLNKLPQPGSWKEKWYSTRQSRQNNTNRLLLQGNVEKKRRCKYSNRNISKINSAKKMSSNRLQIQEAEVGMLCTKRLEIGERVSRVHYSLTTSLWRSRFRKKHFPHGTYPYTYRKGNMMTSDFSSHAL